MTTIGLSLSGERFPRCVSGQIEEIALVRSEYLFREKGVYPTRDNALGIVAEYLETLMDEFNGPIWFRTLDVDTAEANVLDGCEKEIVEKDRLRGLRGIRRSMRYPDAFESELLALSEVWNERLGVVVPFVSTVTEAEWAIKKINHFLPRASVGIMLEIPSLLFMLEEIASLGYERVIVGLNDFGSLYMGTVRKVQLPTGIPLELVRGLQHICESARRNNLEVVVAGYLNAAVVDVCCDVGVDLVSIHYVDLPSILEVDARDLRDFEHLSSVKMKTRQDISEYNRVHNVHQTIY